MNNIQEKICIAWIFLFMGLAIGSSIPKTIITLEPIEPDLIIGSGIATEGDTVFIYNEPDNY